MTAIAIRPVEGTASDVTSVAEADLAAPLLDAQTPAARELLQQLRALVQEVIPQVQEKVHLGWGAIHYGTGGGMRGVVIALLPRPAYVNIEFMDGVDLPDPAHRLEGTGKRLRHVKIRSAADVRHAEVLALLRTAASRRGL